MHATEMKTKRHYTAPVTQRATVELEGGFCGSIMENNGSVTTKGHETGDTYNFEGNTSGDLNGTTEGGGFSVSWD